jgi:hypothetical protein
MAFADERTESARRFYDALRSPLFLSLAALWILLFTAESIRPCFFLHDDNATWFIGAYAHDFRVLTETGRVAEVNYYQYGGEPFLQQGQTAVLYPPVYLGVALATWLSGDVRWSIEWIAAGHLTLGFLGFYFWLRRGGVTPLFAALGGLTWVLNPFVLIVASSWITVTYLACYLPWLFWATDRMFSQPSRLSALFLGSILALFFLQGYAQWVLYSILFLSIYALGRFLDRTEKNRGDIIFYLVASSLIFLMLAAPLLLPMLHAVGGSAARSQPLPIAQALFYRVHSTDLLHAQVGLFHPQIFGLSTAILFCPALLFLPWMIARFFSASSTLRQKLFPLIILALLALLFSSRWHIFLTLMPLFEKFRWPFKVFAFADFFLIASLVWSLSLFATRRWQRAATAVLALVLLANVGVSLGYHEGNTISKTGLTTSANPLPPDMDPNLGRVIAIDNYLPEASSQRFFTHCYATYFAAPSLGGYNPLVSPEALQFGLGLDFPNTYYGNITPAFREKLADRAVRYWIVDPHSPQLLQLQGLAGFRLLASEPDRQIYEDTLAAPMADSTGDALSPLSIIYYGNSIDIPLTPTSSPVEVSIGPTDGWWYRVDGGPWQRGKYQYAHLEIDTPPAAQHLEITYFDARFRRGLLVSLGILPVVVLLLFVGPPGRRRFGNDLTP